MKELQIEITEMTCEAPPEAIIAVGPCDSCTSSDFGGVNGGCTDPANDPDMSTTCIDDIVYGAASMARGGLPGMVSGAISEGARCYANGGGSADLGGIDPDEPNGDGGESSL